MACLATGDAENVKVDLEFKSVNNHTHVFHVPEEKCVVIGEEHDERDKYLPMSSGLLSRVQQNASLSDQYSQ